MLTKVVVMFAYIKYNVQLIGKKVIQQIFAVIVITVSNIKNEINLVVSLLLPIPSQYTFKQALIN